MTTKQNSIVNSELLEEFTSEYLKKHEELINFVKKETEKQLRIADVVGRSEQLVCDCGNEYTETDREHDMCHECWKPIVETN